MYDVNNKFDALSSLEIFRSIFYIFGAILFASLNKNFKRDCIIIL